MSQNANATMTDRDAIERHNRVLLHALQIAHPVLYQGKNRFIHTLRFQLSGGGLDTTVYLTGDPTPLNADQVQLAPRIE